MDDLRKQIDGIDAQIAELLDRRLDVAEKIGQYKMLHGLPVLDEEREAEKIRSFAHNFHEDKRAYAGGVMEAVMKACRNYQEDGRFQYALLGDKLGHSLSPRVHRLLGGYGYGLFECREEDLDEFFRKFPFKGISVTMPYKRRVMEYCAEISETAKAADSVNTIVKKPDGTFAGYNTDYDGFRYTIERSGVDINDRKCLIFGSGGVSGTVKKVLEDCGAGQVIIVSRSGENNYENLKKHCDGEVLVNATPVGMYPDAGISPVDISMFKSCWGAFDLIYNPLRSQFLLDAEKAGIPAFSGLEMLVAQAAYAGMLFTGIDNRGRIDQVCEEIRKEHENIVLIGMPGSGKSSVGRKLAELTGKVFTDTDDFIFESTGRTAEEIISSDGEDVFRDVETEAVRTVASRPGQVIATGGGVVERGENLDMLRSNGRIVYIRRDLESLSDEGRPVSRAEGIDRLYDRRKDIYEAWQDMTVENLDIEETARIIKEEMEYGKDE